MIRENNSIRSAARKEKVLRELMQSDGFITSSQLAGIIGVSSRTIRQDVKQITVELNKEGINLISTPSKGYRITTDDSEKVNTYLKSLSPIQASIPTTPEERTKFIIRKILFEGQFITLDGIADKLFISHSTAEKDFQEVRKWFKNQEIILTKKTYGISKQMDEISIRCAMVNYFWYFYNFSSLSSLQVLKTTIPEEHLKSVKEALYLIHDTNDISMSDSGFLNLIIYLAIMLTRVSEGKSIQENIPQDKAEHTDTKRRLASNIARLFEEKYPFRFNQAEILHMENFLLQANIQFSENSKQSMPIEENLQLFITEVLRILKSSFSLDFLEDQDLIGSLASYLDSLINQKKHKNLIRNPGLDAIIKEYPQALDMAAMISGQIKKHFLITLNENETGTIALYLCAAIERFKGRNTKTKKDIVIICATGVGGAQLLAIKINRYFPDVHIQGIYPFYQLDEALVNKPDLVLSTIPLINTDYPVLQISHLLNSDDIHQIRKALDQTSSLADTDRQILTNLFKASLFFPALETDNSQAVIRKICHGIKECGYVGEDFAQAVLDRESIFPTAIGNLVAIPHAITYHPPDSWIAVGILQKPIRWGNESVQIVFILNIDSTKEDYFKQVYKKLYILLSNKETIAQMTKLSEFNEFIKVINE